MDANEFGISIGDVGEEKCSAGISLGGVGEEFAGILSVGGVGEQQPQKDKEKVENTGAQIDWGDISGDQLLSLDSMLSEENSTAQNHTEEPAAIDWGELNDDQLLDIQVVTGADESAQFANSHFSVSAHRSLPETVLLSVDSRQQFLDDLSEVGESSWLLLWLYGGSGGGSSSGGGGGG
jgi:CDK5 regulatory subunit-associated protein 3